MVGLSQLEKWNGLVEW